MLTWFKVWWYVKQFQNGDEEARQAIGKLLTGDSDVRAAAAEALVQLGAARAVKPLIKALRDSDYDVRRTAANALGRLGDARAVRPLIKALQDYDRNMQENAAEALGQLGNARAVKPLIGVLQDSKCGGWHKREVAKALGELADTRAVEPLIGVLDDFYAGKAAAQALVQLGPCAVVPLIGALQDSESKVRGTAANLLGRLGDSRAVEPLTKTLQDWDVQVTAAESLGQLGDTRAVKPLIVALQNSGYDMRRAAAKALGELGDARAVKRLIVALRDSDNDVRRAAVVALKQLGWQSSDPVWRVLNAIERRDVAGCVDEGAAAVKPLIVALGDTDDDVRRAAAEALGRLGDARAIKPLVATIGRYAREGKEMSLKRAIANSLESILRAVNKAIIPEGQLQSIASLSDCHVTESRETNDEGAVGRETVVVGTISLSDLRQLAEQELARRQSKATKQAAVQAGQPTPTISLACSNCEKKLRIAAKQAGQLPCPACQQPIVIPLS